jgi:acetylornithine deacetylase/succinyl-diaminopimelate desuccinylase-like protein
MRHLLPRLLPTLFAVALSVGSAAAQGLDPQILEVVSQITAARIDTDIQTLVGFGTRNSCSNDSGTMPGIGAARDWIRDQFAAIPGLTVMVDPYAQTGCGAAGMIRHNVIAWLPGVGNPNRLIVIGGHYDSRTLATADGLSLAPGANDSGSQAALVLEAARALALHRYDATIVFAVWAGEEQGLVGSSSFVSRYRTYFPNGTIELNLTFDIVGGDNTVNSAAALQQFRLYSPGTPREISSGDGTTDDTSPSRGVMRHIGHWGAQYVPAMAMVPKLREDRPSRGSDHKSFIKNGIPGVRFIETNETTSHQHSGNDLYSYVTPSYTAAIAQVVVAATANLARAPKPPRSMTARRLSNNRVQVSWAVPAGGPAVDHYVVSARRVSENFYVTRHVVPASTLSATLSIPNQLGITSGSFYVSVAAVDVEGHESLYAYSEYRCTSSSCSVPSGSLDVTRTR